MQFLMFQRSLVPSSAESNRIFECVTLEAKHHFPSKHQEFNSQWQGVTSQETGVCSSTTLRTSDLAKTFAFQKVFLNSGSQGKIALCGLFYYIECAQSPQENRLLK